MNIVHISNTPLVGAPSKISESLKLLGHNSICINVADYPNNGPLFKKFTDLSIVLSDDSYNSKDMAMSVLEAADIIHIHNELPEDVIKLVLKHGSNAEFVYQVHSPLREGPLYVDRSNLLGITFSAKCVVAQYQPRQYQDFIPVPNIITSGATVNFRKKDEKLKVVFSPTHSRGGRWNAKTSDKADSVLDVLSKIDSVELIYPKTPVHPSVLMTMRRFAHLSIDEVITGAFHQVSLEGLIAGNVVVNNSDFFSKMAMADSHNCSYGDVPFVNANDETLLDTILKYANDVDLTVESQIKSNKFAVDYMSALELVKGYERVYNSII